MKQTVGVLTSLGSLPLDSFCLRDAGIAAVFFLTSLVNLDIILAWGIPYVLHYL